MRSKTTEKLLKELRKIREPFEETLNSISITVYPNVYPPRFDSKLLARNLDLKYGDSVLDLGTGSGVQAIVAAKKGAKVIATDINPVAIKCAKFNAIKNNVISKIEFMEGYLFSPIKKRGKFNVIVANLPFERAIPKDLLEWAVYDPYFRTLRGLFTQAKSFLVENGNIQMVYADYADLESLKRFAKGYRMVTIAIEKFDNETNFVLKFVPIFN